MPIILRKVPARYFITVARIGQININPESADSYHHHETEVRRKVAVEKLKAALVAAATFNDGEFEGWVVEEVGTGDAAQVKELVRFTAGRNFVINLTEIN